MMNAQTSMWRSVLPSSSGMKRADQVELNTGRVGQGRRDHGVVVTPYRHVGNYSGTFEEGARVSNFGADMTVSETDQK